jgi:hypothetical protein
MSGNRVELGSDCAVGFSQGIESLIISHVVTLSAVSKRHPSLLASEKIQEKLAQERLRMCASPSVGLLDLVLSFSSEDDQPPDWFLHAHLVSTERPSAETPPGRAGCPLLKPSIAYLPVFSTDGC